MSAPCCTLPGPVYQQSEEGGTSRQPAAPGRQCGQTAVHHFPSHQAFGQQQQQQQRAQHAVQSFQLMFWSTTIKLLPRVRCSGAL